MNYILTAEDLLVRLVNSQSMHSKNIELFVDYILKCHEEGEGIQWDIIARHVTRYRLRQLRFAEHCIRLARNKIFNGYMYVTEPHP